MANPAGRAAAWVDLPRELTANILQRLSVEDIFKSAQVCTAWWRICQDPSMWRYVDLWDLVVEREWDKICREVVNRSEGQLISIKLGHFATDDLLFYIAQRAKQLRHLGISSCYVSDEGFSKAVNEFPLLEEVQLKYCSEISTEGVGRSCPFLNSFSLIKVTLRGFPYEPSDEDAVAIAENMRGLKHLTLGGNEMTDKGVEAILDGCPSLQSLNIDHCDHVSLEGELGKRCSQQIKDLNHIQEPIPYVHDFTIFFMNYLTVNFDEIDVREAVDCEHYMYFHFLLFPLNCLLFVNSSYRS